MRRSLAPSQFFCGVKGKRDIKTVVSLLNSSQSTSSDLSQEEKCFKENIQQNNEIPDNKKCEDKEIHIVNKINSIQSDVAQYTVVWGKPSTKKHKTWDGDGVLKVTSKSLTLYSEDGTVLGSKSLNTPMSVEVGQILSVGSKVVEVIEPLLCSNTPVTTKRAREEDTAVPTRSAPTKMAKKKSFQCPLNDMQSNETMNKADQFVLPRPPNSHQWNHNDNKNPATSVKVDFFLSTRLRPHQKDGLAFLYSCVLGFESEYTGAILADEMGLGKTLQCIALIWTLLKQGPYGRPVIKKAMIITPSTLCGTWQKEFLKWLGRERLTPYVIDNNNKPIGFKARPHLPVMIISYERFAKHSEEIQMMNFDIIICDEAHRLKNANIKAAQALQNLDCKKRILLTGTPIQNDLQEYYVLIDIANPGILGTYNEFKEKFVLPILTSQKPGCTDEESVTGEQSAVHLQQLTSSFILRRTQILLKDYLPMKTECVICCNATQLQEKLYSLSLDDWWSRREFGAAPSPLSLIVLLKKICNDPLLLKNKSSSLNDVDDLLVKLQEMLPNNQINFEECSGKLSVVISLIKNVIFNKKEKLVIVSCSTKMLNVLSDVCNRISVLFTRLDGNTPVSNRQTIVESFNSQTGPPVLLLSSRAGGTGLSLPAASHLVLYDSDWNPAVDNQAMARIWRDGQRKPVFIYRLLVTGSIEEKIYQRQMFKMGISDAIADPDKVKSTLKLCDSELKELFITNFTTQSSTHDMLDCKCAGDGTADENLETFIEKEDDTFGVNKNENVGNIESSINQLKTWDHFRIKTSNDILQELGLEDLESNISFIFRKKLI